MDRELDGVYFRTFREDKWDNVCFSDLTEEEMNEVLKNKDKEFITGLAIILGKTIKVLGDTFDICSKRE